MASRRRAAFLGAAAIAVVCVLALRGPEKRLPERNPTLSRSPTGVAGRVVEGTAPVQAARISLQGQADFVLTDANGEFELPVGVADGAVLTAAKDGYFIAGLPVGATPLEVRLTALPKADCAGYRWVDPRPNAESSRACGNCHEAMYQEWRQTGHALSAANRHTLGLIDGSDWAGNRDHGWSLADEYPEGVGVCWSCHAPSLDEARGDFDLRNVRGVAAQGVHCDFCHKIRAATADASGLTHGRFGYELLRPAEGQIFFGPLADVDRGEDVYSPLQSQSRFCAACHEGTLFGVPVYTTFSEWLASPAAGEGRQCQSCHMKPSGTMTNVAPTFGGIERDPSTLASHTFLPGGRQAMLRGAVDVSFTATQHASATEATLVIEAKNIGHRLPTGFIDRHLILIVEPFDADGRSVALLDGPRLPKAAGENLAGKAGRLFARLLTDADGRAPAPFWRAGVSVTESRLSPQQPETIDFRLSPATTTIRVRLLYRRFWREVSESKSWPNADIVVYDRSFAIGANSH